MCDHNKNGSMFSRQPKLQRQCHQDIMEYVSKCLDLNNSDQRKITGRVTSWFDKASFEIPEIELD